MNSSRRNLTSLDQTKILTPHLFPNAGPERTASVCSRSFDAFGWQSQACSPLPPGWRPGSPPPAQSEETLQKKHRGSWELFLYCTECSSRSTGAPARPMVTHSWSCYRLVRCIQLNTVTMRKGNVLQVQSALHRNVLVIADMATMRHETPRSCLAPYTKLKYSVCVISHSFFL